MDQIEVKRVDDAYAFLATDSNGNTARLDASSAIGGHDSGIRPMQSLLMGLGGCGGVDIISILKKQKQSIIDFRMVIKGEREQGKEPSLWKTVSIDFYFSGEVEKDKAEKAIALSLNKYCSVAATLRAAGCTIDWTVTMN
jgi:putative redox protein